PRRAGALFLPIVLAVVLTGLVWQFCPTTLRAEALPEAAGIEFFENKIRPLLAAHCYACHSEAKKKSKGGLLLDTRGGMLKGGDNGPALIARDVSKSLLLKAVHYKDEELQMPPDGKLSAEQIADLEAWVKMGAPDPRESAPSAVANTASMIDLKEGRRWWAYQPPKSHPLPAVKDATWAKQPIDRFILAKLEEKGLNPSPAADRRTLIRRAYFDLIGLPPPKDEVEAFVADAAPDAYAKLIDKLLASPLYGQRWARHWLDVVRYTDSFDSRVVGGPNDCAFAWRYRDWVVDSFNRDLPYDRFVQEQVAGDLIPSIDGKPFNKDGIIATGVYMIGEWGGGDADKDKLISDIVDDQVDLTGRAFMGLTVACARCHDHKFDPISTKDYYGLAGIYYSSRILSDYGPKGGSPVNVRAPLMSEGELAQRKADEARVAQLTTELESALDAQYTQLASAMLPQADKYLTAAWEYEHYKGGAARPSIAEFARQRGLRGYELSQWTKFIAAPQLDLLTQRVPGPNGLAGIHGWRNAVNADAPVVLINTLPQAIDTVPTLTLAGRSVNLHPSPTAGVAVTWKSPINGRVRITGRVTDGHAVCGDGIAWSLSSTRGQSPGEIASGTIANGGMQALAEGTGGLNLASVDIVAGEMIQLAILAKVEYTCDTTGVDLQIVELDAPGRTWDLTKDATAPGRASNPLPDSYGNATTWNFHDLAMQSGAAFASGSPMSRFTVAMGASPDGTALTAAAGDVAQALVAIDAEARKMRAEGKDPASLATPEAAFHQLLTAPRGAFWSPARADDVNLDLPVRDQLAAKRAETKGLRDKVSEPIPVAQAVQEGGTPKSLFPGIQDVPVHIRGRYDKLGDVVPRRFPQVIAGETQPPINQGSGRLELAKWLASPEHPLTARVMVNRIWQHHFGDGIVRTPNNFGKLGTPPTHPELLDQLAVEFVKGGWSIKAMHRMMMLSATYQQSSETSEQTFRTDPDNLLLGRINRRKLDAESLRDAMLDVAGKLDTSAGGVAINDLNTPRRSLYVMTIRSDRADYRSLFDAADASAIVEKRIDSTVAPQALFLMNHPFVLDRARQLAERVAKEGGGDDAAKVDWLYRTLFARQPDAQELEVGKSLVASDSAGWQPYCHVLLCANEFMYVD
ncbi:MAG: PSD1 and planctomycete cytochrome C domain-containing protein, partial [Planctomycetota bacterium]|nr:PSD1 and planctomycete cytochrome C domain-containing protein [Planctomycetota bacterium]